MPSTIGQRRTRVLVQSKTQTPDALGQLQDTWSTAATVWGYLRPATGRELMVAGQTKALLSHVVETRWPGSLVTVTPEHRLSVNGKLYNVTWADNLEGRNRTLVIGCTELAAGA